MLYFLVSLVAICKLVKVAADQPVAHVDIGISVYALLNREITFAANAVGVGAATIGTNGDSNEKYTLST